MLKDLLYAFRILSPIVFGLVLFQILILRSPLQKPYTLLGGYLLTLVGLFMFLKGISLCLIPIGESVGQPSADHRRGVPVGVPVHPG